jgi:hypothetical protein
MLRRSLLFVLLLSPSLQSAEPFTLTIEDADARLRRVYALARETNDAGLLDRALGLRDSVKRSFARKDLVAAERLIRDAEELVGLEAGGKKMHGLPVARIDHALRKKLDPIEAGLAAALQKQDAPEISKVLVEMKFALGEQAGLPDVRRKGERARMTPAKPAEIAELFLKVIESEPRVYKFLAAGRPGPETLPRAYAAVVQSCLLIRPAVEAHHKDRLKLVDDLIRGCCTAMLSIQMEAGFFRMPDLRATNLVLGDIIERIAEKDPDALKDGWLVVPDPEGSTHHDTSECGIALLEAGKALGNAEWTKAGLKAADWSMAQPLVKQLYFNAFSVSLLCTAQRMSDGRKYGEAALRKYRLGVEPGQLETGRWMDPYQARTSNQFVFLRAIHDLIESTPPGKDRDQLVSSSQKAVKAILEEIETLGIPMTTLTVQELERHLRVVPEPLATLRALVEEAASNLIQKSQVRPGVRVSVSWSELAATAKVWAK